MFTMVRSKLLRSPVRVFSSAVCVLTVFHCYRALNLHLTHTSPSVFMWRQTGQSEDSEATADCGAEGPLISDLCRGNIHKQTFTLTNDPHKHWVTFDPGMTSGRPGHTCLREGTHNRSRDQCVCRAGWHGAQCGVPTVVQHSNLAHRGRLSRRSQPRRIINAVNVNHEFDLLHARFNELSSAVDLFMVCESNYTAAGGSKPLTFLRMLLNGTLDYVKHKILYVFLDHFPRGAERHGWLADDHFRTFLTRDGLSRVRGSRPDDVFLINDADEIPTRAGVLFLKLYDGWTEPVAFHLRRSLYGFYWREPGTLDILSACTLGMLEAVYQNDGILLRRRHHYDLPGYLQYQEDSGRQVELWSVGSQVHFAGWHCSWCFSLEGIQYKLVSAQNGDFPRWGDYPEKRDLGYIKDLVRTGGWFDGSTCNCLPSHRGEPMYAPRFLLDHFPQYRHLLENPYINRSTQT